MFDVAGHWVAHAGRHRAWALWLLFALLAVGCTVVLSLDTTAVLLTPVGSPWRGRSTWTPASSR